MSVFTLCGVHFQSIDARMAAKQLTVALRSPHGHTCVFTPNTKIISSCRLSPSLRRLINSGDILLPDGAGINILCRLRGLPHVPRITGIDMGLFLLKYCARHGIPVYFLGGKPQVARRAAQRLKKQIPNLNICGVHHGYFDKSRTSEENKAVIGDINSATPALLFVCMGFPEQELWMRENIGALPSVRVCMGLGGSLDVWCGDARRAPMCVRLCSLEWLWRMILKKIS